MNDFPRQYASTRRFTLGTPRNLRVTPDGTTVVFCRSQGPTDPVLCLWSLDTTTGNERLLVDPGVLSGDDHDLPAAERARRERARESADGIVAYSMDTAGDRIAFALAGDLYTGSLREATFTALPTGGPVFDPVIDPTGRRVAYVGGASDGLWTVATTGDEPAQSVVDDADPLVSWGRAEFVAAEEMSRTRGMWWSPDGSQILAQRTAEHDVPIWWIGDPAHPSRAPRPIRYPFAGATNATVGLTLFTIDGSRDPVDLDWSEGGRFEYLATVVWSKDHEPVVVRQTRDQRIVEVVEWGCSTDSPPRVLRRIEDATWVELVPGSPTWCRSGLLTVEDGPTTRSLYLDGERLTPDGFQVRSIVHATADTVFVSASTDDPTQTHLFTVSSLVADDADRPVDPVAITHDPGVHSLVVAADTTVVISARPEHHGVEIGVRRNDISLHIADHSAVPTVVAAPRFFEAGPRRLATAVFLPTDHDGTTVLPVLLDPYGGPHAQRVTRTHNGHLVSQWFADQGYAVVVADGRGTPGRGPRFERSVWGDLAGPVLDDQIDALDAAADHVGCLDLDRVGIRGWSFGGYLAALAALRRPDRFHAAIAGAPVTDWRLYDTHYTERYLGMPAEQGDHYDRCDITAEADSLRRPLLLIHGLADDNVVAAHTLRLSTALLGAGRAHQVLPLSGVTHMTPQEAVAENLLRLQLDFLDAHLSPSRRER